MYLTKLLLKSPYLIVAGLTIYFLAMISLYQSELPQQTWHYYISQQQFSRANDQHHLSSLKLQHDGQGHYQPLQLKIQTRSNSYHTLKIDDLNHTHIDEILEVSHQNIKHAILKSDHPLNFKSQAKVRLLSGMSQDPFVTVSGRFFQILLPLLRNLIIVGIILNLVDTFLPLIIITQSVLMFAFLDNQKHYLQTFFNQCFNSNFDFFYIIRNQMFAASITGNSLLTQYGFGNSLLYNISGELTILVIFFVLTIAIKAGAAFLKFQRLRRIAAKLRPIWNGVLFALMPRMFTFASFSVRDFANADSIQTMMYPIIGVLIYSLYMVYYVAMFLQVRQINQKVQYLQQSHSQIGLVSRLNYKRNFQFDCLEYSNLYYPVMNFGRLLLFYVPLGACYDMTYISFGGVIVSQLFYVMFTVSSSGFVKGRDSFVYPMTDFLIIILQLAHISVGLAESVMHSEVSIIAEQVFFAILLGMYFLLVTSLAADIAAQIKLLCVTSTSNDDGQKTINKLKKIVKRKSSKRSNQSKATIKLIGKKSENSSQSNQNQNQNQNQNSQQQSSVSSDNEQQKAKLKNALPNLNSKVNKVRKIRNGKLI